MRKFLKNVWYVLKGTWFVWLTIAAIIVAAIVIMMTNPHNPISIWLKDLYGTSPP